MSARVRVVELGMPRVAGPVGVPRVRMMVSSGSSMVSFTGVRVTLALLAPVANEKPVELME